MLPSEFTAKAKELGLKWQKEYRREKISGTLLTELTCGITIMGAHGHAGKFFSLETLTSHSKPALEQALATLKKQDDVQQDYERLGGSDDSEANPA